MHQEGTEEALMEAYVAGDPGAFQRLFRLLAPSILAFFRRSVGDGAAAEDLLQTTFLKIHRARGSWRPGEKLRPWVFTIAARVRLDWLRRNGRRGDEEQLDGDTLEDRTPPDNRASWRWSRSDPNRCGGRSTGSPSRSALWSTCIASKG